nr:hypothetical protein [Tanacetum cinerariifolium]
MFSDENAYHKPSPPAKKIPYNATIPYPSSLQSKAKKLKQKANKNIRNINFKKLSEVKKFCDGTLVKIQENLIDMVTKNKLGKGNKRLKGRYWTDDDVVKSNEMVNKIYKILKHREQLRRLEEYVGRRPKTVDPCTFVRHM